MRITVSKHAGFCAGVENAVRIARCAAKTRGKAFANHPLIHNAKINAELERIGIEVRDPSTLEPGDVAIISAHGASERMKNGLRERGIEVIDATCPFLAKTFEKVREFARRGFAPIVFGDPSHAEVLALTEDYPNCQAVSDASEIDFSGDGPYLALAQSTFCAESFSENAKRIKIMCASLNKTVEILKSICYTTLWRQKDAECISRKADAMLVIGDRASSNALRLMEICVKNCANAHLIEDISDLETLNLRGAQILGIVSAASAPKELITEVIGLMDTNEKTGSVEPIDSERIEQGTAPAERAADEAPIANAPESEGEGAKPEEPAKLEAETADASADESEKSEPEAGESEKSEPEAGESEKPEPEAKKPNKPATDAEDEESEEKLSPMARAMKTGYANDRQIHTGSVVDAIVISADSDGISVSISGLSKNDLGTIMKEDAELDRAYDPSNYPAGTELKCVVVHRRRSEKQTGTCLSRKQYLQQEIDNEKVKGILEGEEFEIVPTTCITNKAGNKVGLLGRIGTYSVFIPSAHLGLGFVKEVEEFLNKPLRLIALPPREGDDPSRNYKRIVASHKAVLQKERKEKIDEYIDTLREGDIVEGVVKNFNAKYGVFVRLKYLDGLVHSTDLSWSAKRVSDPSTILELNKKYDFIIKNVDKEHGKIALGYKQLQPRPWEIAKEKYPAGTILEGTVVNIISYGAFVELEPGIDGLVHVSHISKTFLNHPSEALKIGDVVKVKVLPYDRDRISLSMKDLEPREERRSSDGQGDEGEKRSGGKSKRGRGADYSDEGPRNYTDSTSNGNYAFGDILTKLNGDESAPAEKTAVSEPEEKPAREKAAAAEPEKTAHAEDEAKAELAEAKNAEESNSAPDEKSVEPVAATTEDAESAKPEAEKADGAESANPEAEKIDDAESATLGAENAEAREPEANSEPALRAVDDSILGSTDETNEADKAETDEGETPEAAESDGAKTE